MLFEVLTRVSKSSRGKYEVNILYQCTDGAFKTPYDQFTIKPVTLEKAAQVTHNPSLMQLAANLPVALYDYSEKRFVPEIATETTVLAGASDVTTEQLSELLAGVLSALVESYNGVLVIECHTGVRKHEFYGKDGCAELSQFCKTTF